MFKTLYNVVYTQTKKKRATSIVQKCPDQPLFSDSKVCTLRSFKVAMENCLLIGKSSINRPFSIADC